MSVEVCQFVLEKLRQGAWQALLLTDDCLLIIHSVATDGKSKVYKRVSSVDIDVKHTKEHCRLERDDFVKECTELVDIALV